MKYGWFLLIGGAVAAVAGCGSSSDAPPASIPAGQANSAQTATPSTIQVEPPETVVTSFLESLRKGDDTLAASLLTETARQETTKKGLKVQPPGTPDMTYQIGQTEYVTPEKNGAHVGSIWSEKLPSGEIASFEVIWVLRLEPQGWRIAGMATPVGDASEPLFLNFEDPDDLLQKWQETETEVAGAEQPANNPPQEPAPQNTAQQGEFNPLR